MEYVQMTLDDWVQMKQKLKQELLGVKQSFVRIGYALRQIDDQKLYEQDGYKSIAEFAQAEYGLGPSITSRFMSINREYSIDGYSEQLRPEYVELGRSQLEEMLKLPDTDRQMIQPETSREDIRELKGLTKLNLQQAWLMISVSWSKSSIRTMNSYSMQYMARSLMSRQSTDSLK